MRQGKRNILNIRTPEGITFPLSLSGPIPRLLSCSIDFFAIAVIWRILSSLINVLAFMSGDLAKAISILAYFVISIGYRMILEYYWRGQTLGKRVMGLRVMDEQGLHLRFSQVVIRNLLRVIDALPIFYMVGGLSCLLSRKAQRLGDFVANTVVVRNPKLSTPDLTQILSGKYNSFHDYPHLEARLRQRVTPQQAGVVLQALLRRQQLDPMARILLFEEIAAFFKKIVEFPQEATDGISDEQYLRNVVDTLFRPNASST